MAYNLCIDERQDLFDSPMPWIGMYVAAASLVCSIAMAADVIHGFLCKKLWFPCKFFTLNAASLTILAVVMKLPVDLTTAMWGLTDQIAKVSSTVFMNTVMGNLMTSFASMDNNSILMNITALGILVITVIVNVCIQMRTTLIDGTIWGEEIVVIVLMLVLFLTLSSSALTVPTTKRYLEMKYSELHKTALNEVLEETEKLQVQKLKEALEKFWVMAETSSPQFVMARSVTCATSGVICLLTALTLVEAQIRMHQLYSFMEQNHSNYGWSTTWILVIHFIGVAVGTVATTFRWFTVISFKRSKNDDNSYLYEFKVEKYWIQRLVEWKERPLALPFRGRKFRKLLQDTKNLLLDFCIGTQIAIVAVSKAVRLVSFIFTSPLFSCFYYCKRLKRKLKTESVVSTNQGVSEPETSTELDLSNYVLQLEGEVKLPKRILKNIRNDVNQLIEQGRRQQPKNLMELLRKSNSFKGVAEFDSDQVPYMYMHSKKPPNCWTLPVVTLTSIAIALPNIENDMVHRLLSGVNEGLLYARLVQENLGSRGDLLNIKHAADALWVGVELYSKWLEEDLRKIALNAKTSRDTTQSLADIAEKRVKDFQRSLMEKENPLNWPVKVIAANSMYRISRTILMGYENSKDQSDEEMFKQLYVMIADILGACLTNLPLLITTKCYSSAMEKREKNVRDATRLLGETEEIIKILQEHELPSLSHDQLAYIDEWHALLQHQNPSIVISSSNNVITSSGSGELHISIQ